MSSTKEKKKTPLKLSQPGRLELKKTVESGEVRQSFSHGRSKAVAVEIKRKRTFKTSSSGDMTEVTAAPAAEATPETVVTSKASPTSKTPVGPSRNLTESERAARERAIEAAKEAASEVEATTRVAGEEPVGATDGPAVPGDAPAPSAARPAESAEEAERRNIEEAATRQRAEEEQRLQAGADLSRAAAEAQGDVAPRGADGARARAAAAAGTPATAEDEEAPRGRGGRSARATANKGTAGGRQRGGGARRRGGKLTINQALDDDRGEKHHSVAALRRRQQREKQKIQGQFSADQGAKRVREAVVPETITVSEFANRLAIRANDVVRVLMKMEIMATANQTIDQDTAELVAEELGHKIRRISAADVEIGIGGEPDADDAQLEARSPVVTVMGHVDHGKTSLLDALRATDVVTGEAGGITQHIGAYQVEISNGSKITFLDTPGHEAFTEMRQRGANVTDIVVLVVAADDGVRPQTIEAINHAKAAEVPIIVAINKMDKSGADPTRVRNELLSHEIVTEQMGGEIQCIEVSALEKQNLDGLEEAIVLQAEILELKANSERQAYGTVVEARLERGRGPVATILVQRGTLRIGDIFVAGGEWGRVRALIDDRGNNVQQAGPSQPIEILGLNGAPLAGEEFAVTDNEARAREIAEYRQQLVRDKRAAAGARGSLEQMFEQIQAGEAAEVPLVLKADVQGSVEAIIGALEKLGTEEVQVRILHHAVGGITESDISLAAASAGIVIGFNVRANAQANDQARQDRIDIRYYSVIYNLIDDVKALMEGKLAPTIRENRLGQAEIREVFSVSKIGKVAGCMVSDGMVRRGAKVRLLRDDMVIHEGDLSTLKRFKDDVREVREGYECGLSLERYDNIQIGDVVECFEQEEVARHL